MSELFHKQCLTVGNGVAGLGEPHRSFKHRALEACHLILLYKSCWSQLHQQSSSNNKNRVQRPDVTAAVRFDPLHAQPSGASNLMNSSLWQTHAHASGLSSLINCDDNEPARDWWSIIVGRWTFTAYTWIKKKIRWLWSPVLDRIIQPALS